MASLIVNPQQVADIIRSDKNYAMVKDQVQAITQSSNLGSKMYGHAQITLAVAQYSSEVQLVVDGIVDRMTAKQYDDALKYAREKRRRCRLMRFAPNHEMSSSAAWGTSILWRFAIPPKRPRLH